MAAALNSSHFNFLKQYGATRKFQCLKPFNKEPTSWSPIKVSKFQKQIFLFLFEPKTKRNYFLISGLRI